MIFFKKNSFFFLSGQQLFEIKGTKEDILKQQNFVSQGKKKMNESMSESETGEEK